MGAGVFATNEPSVQIRSPKGDIMIKRGILAAMLAAILSTPSIALADLAVGGGSSQVQNSTLVVPNPIAVNVLGLGIGADKPLSAVSSTTGVLDTEYAPVLPSGRTAVGVIIHLPTGSSVSFYVSQGAYGTQGEAQARTQTYSNSGSDNKDIPLIYLSNFQLLWFTNVTCGSSGAQTSGCPSYRWM
jgi:hypothetical protein